MLHCSMAYKIVDCLNCGMEWKLVKNKVFCYFGGGRKTGNKLDFIIKATMRLCPLFRPRPKTPRKTKNQTFGPVLGTRYTTVATNQLIHNNQPQETNSKKG